MAERHGATPRAVLRREGMADAVVLLVARKVSPLMTVDDWCRELGLERTDVKAALDRLKASGGDLLDRANNSYRAGRRAQGREAIPLVRCQFCGRRFMERGLPVHLARCSEKPRPHLAVVPGPQA